MSLLRYSILDNKPWKRALIVLCCLLTLLPSWLWIKRARATDFFRFWVVGQAVKTMLVTDVYSFSDIKLIRNEFILRSSQPGNFQGWGKSHEWQKLFFVGTPLLYSIFSLATFGHYDNDLFRFQVLSMFVYALSVLALCALFRFKVWAWPLFVSAAIYLYWPLWVDVYEANVNRLQLGGLTLFILLRRMPSDIFRQFFSAILLTSMILFKPNLTFILAPFLLWNWLNNSLRSNTVFLLGFFLSLLFGLLLPQWVLGSTCQWNDWLASLQHLGFRWVYMKKSFLSLTYDEVELPWFSFFAVLSLGLFMIFLFWINVLNHRSNRIFGRSHALIELLIVSLSIILYLLTSPMVHGHYFVLLIPLILCLVRPQRVLSPIYHAPKWLCFLAVLCINAYPLLEKMGWTTVPDLTLWSYLGALLLFVAGAMEITHITRPAVFKGAPH